MTTLPPGQAAAVALKEATVGISRIRDEFALVVDHGAAITTLNLTRDEARELALRLLEVTQR